MAGSVTAGRILSGTASMVADNALGAGLYLAVFGGGGATATYLDGIGTPETQIAGGLVQIVFSLGSIVCGYLLTEQMLKQAGLFHNAGPRRFFAYIGQSILTVLGTLLGALLLVVPGIILAVRWSAASAILVGTGAGPIESISRSWQATRGHGVQIFLAVLPLGLLFLFALGAAVAIGTEGQRIGAIVAQSFATEMLSVLNIAMAAALFGLLAPATEELDDVFS